MPRTGSPKNRYRGRVRYLHALGDKYLAEGNMLGAQQCEECIANLHLAAWDRSFAGKKLQALHDAIIKECRINQKASKKLAFLEETTNADQDREVPEV